MSAIIGSRHILALGRSICYTNCSRSLSTTATMNKVAKMSFSKLRRPLLQHLQRRKEYLIKHNALATFERWQFIEWNYESERYAFCVRLNEDINTNLLIKALDANNFDEVFSLAGRKLIDELCYKFLRYTWPQLPEEGIYAAWNFLQQDLTLSTVANGIGMKDLIVSDNYPLSDEMYAKCFCSVVNAIKKTSGVPKAEKFILDFVITQLVGKEIWDMWNLSDPYEAVKRILHNSGRGEAEPRLLGVLGRGTIETVVRVGIYSDQELIGEGCEHTAELALTIAAYDCLTRFFQQSHSRQPMNFETIPEEMHQFYRPNVGIKNWKITC